MKDMLEQLNALLEDEQPEKVLRTTERIISWGKWFSEYDSSHDEAEIRALRGWAHLKLGNLEDAFVCFNTALGLDPENERAALGLKSL